MTKTRDMKEEIHPDISIDSSVRNTKFNDQILQNLIPSFTADILRPQIIYGRNVLSSRTSSSYDSIHIDNIKISIGISSIYRTNNNIGSTYLIETIKSLIENIHEENKKFVKISIFLADTDEVKIQKVVKSLENEDDFDKYFESGFIAVFRKPEAGQLSSSHSNQNLKWQLLYDEKILNLPTFNDNLQRRIWRTQQNLDYIYLWSSILKNKKFKFTHFLQLEDDITILSKRIPKLSDANTNSTGCLYKEITKHIQILKENKDPFLILDFPNTGFIAKLLPKDILNKLLLYTSIYYKSKPCDWILSNFIQDFLCSPEMLQRTCNRQVKKFHKVVANYGSRKAMFHHIGRYSSLEGQVRSYGEGKMVEVVP